MLVVVGCGLVGACGGETTAAPSLHGSFDGGDSDADWNGDSNLVADTPLDSPVESAPPDTGPSAFVLVSGEPPIADLAVDATHVYYVTSPAKLKRVPKAGGPTETLNDGSLDSGMVGAALAMAPNHVFWANALDGIVARVDKASGAMKILSSDEGSVLDVATTGAYVLWENDAGLRALATAPGSAVVTVASLSVGSGGIAASSDSAYLVSSDGMILRFAPTASVQPSPGVVIAAGQQHVAAMHAGDGGALYWVLRGEPDGCGSTIRRALAGGPVEDWIDVPCPQSSCGEVHALGVSGSVAYIGREKCGLQRLDSATGQTVDLGPPNTEARVAVDDASVFWATSSGSVLRIAKEEKQ